ncbi:MAG: hypothetical protein RIC55_36785 [Pirellulaceae bacterium]
MSERNFPMSMRIGTACLFTLFPIVIFAFSASDMSQAFSPVLGEASPGGIMDRDAVPPGAYLTIRGIPKSAVTIGPPPHEALSIFKEAPLMVLYSPQGHPYTREILASDPGGDFYQREWEVQGRIDLPPGARLPPDELERFVRTEIGPDQLSKIRLLYVGAEPSDARANALLGGAFGVFSLVIALFAWIGVVIPLLRGGGKDAAKSDDPSAT